MAGVVVGTCRSGSCAGAVLWAVEAAGLRQVPVTLLHAWADPVEVEVAVPAAPRGGQPCWHTARVVSAAPADALLDAAADLVVLGLPDGARRPPRLVRAVLATTRVPVAVVPQAWQVGQGPVVVGLCGSTASAAALSWAAAEAGRRRVELVAVHAWQGPIALGRRSRSRGAYAGVDQQVRGWLGRVPGASQVALELCEGPRLEALLAAAAGAGLLVLGRGPHTAAGRPLTGTVGPDLIALAGCPVAVVPAPAPA